MKKLTFLILSLAGLSLSACASSLPPNFVYETSLRGEQGLPGRAERLNSAESLLEGGVVQDPTEALQAAFPDADVKVKRWGLRYFSSNWARYQIVLDADIEEDDVKTRCREVSTDTPVGAPTLEKALADNGAETQRHLETLVRACIEFRNSPI